METFIYMRCLLLPISLSLINSYRNNLKAFLLHTIFFYQFW